jgi:serine/threonine protein phosphatase PrpC
MLRIAEQWFQSDLGRQRQGNEDSLFVRAPLFVVADGMGGAQAGEVASDMAVRSFEPGLGDGRPAEALVRLIEEANRRIHERSRAEEHRAGMGTTVTAAYVDHEEVVVAHVGDSRAYLLRDGDLIRLTKDHSLVWELVARGKLTEEEAEAHPQRSVITRALGPEPHVQVDVDVFGAKAGDVFLLCSDGLTSMVPEPRVKPILLEAPSLDGAGRALVEAANEAGGRDNITVILFRLEEVDEGAAQSDAREADTAEHAAMVPTRAGSPRPQPRSEGASDEQEAAYRASGTVAVSALEPRAAAEAAVEPPPPRAAAPTPRRRRRRLRISTGVVLTLFLAACLVAGLWLATRAVYFIGTDPRDGRTIAIFRGLPYELPLGIELYERYYPSGVTIDDVPASRRDAFRDHKLRSRDDAESLVIQLERGQLES